MNSPSMMSRVRSSTGDGVEALEPPRTRPRSLPPPLESLMGLLPPLRRRRQRTPDGDAGARRGKRSPTPRWTIIPRRVIRWPGPQPPGLGVGGADGVGVGGGVGLTHGALAQSPRRMTSSGSVPCSVGGGLHAGRRRLPARRRRAPSPGDRTGRPARGGRPGLRPTADPAVSARAHVHAGRLDGVEAPRATRRSRPRGRPGPGGSWRCRGAGPSPSRSPGAVGRPLAVEERNHHHAPEPAGRRQGEVGELFALEPETAGPRRRSRRSRSKVHTRGRKRPVASANPATRLRRRPSACR